MFLPQALDAFQSIEMTHAILRHRRFPLVHASEDRVGAQSKDLLQLLPHDPYNLVVAELPSIFCILPRKETAQQCAVFRCAMREFVVGKQTWLPEIKCLRSLRGTRNPNPGGSDRLTSSSLPSPHLVIDEL